MDEQQLRGDGSLPTSVDIAELVQHGVIGACPEQALACLQKAGRLRLLPMGSVLRDDPMVRFVIAGAVGVFASPTSSCVGFIGPGGLHGLDRCFAPATGEHLVALVETRLLEVPAGLFVAAVGRVWTERMFGHQATGRLRAMAAEAACGARHTVSRRTARWLLRLAAAISPDRPISITQLMLARMLGVQRTTVNAALCVLQDGGAVVTARGSVAILSQTALRDLACSCESESRWLVIHSLETRLSDATVAVPIRGGGSMKCAHRPDHGLAALDASLVRTAYPQVPKPT